MSAAASRRTSSPSTRRRTRPGQRRHPAAALRRRSPKPVSARGVASAFAGGVLGTTPPIGAVGWGEDAESGERLLIVGAYRVTYRVGHAATMRSRQARRNLPDPAVRRATTCSRGSPTGRGGLSSWRKKKPGCSITTTLARSTSCSASSMRARVLRPRRWSRLGSALRRCGSRSRRSSARASRRRPGTSRSPRARRRCLSFRCARRCSSATTTSAPSTSCLA